MVAGLRTGLLGVRGCPNLVCRRLPQPVQQVVHGRHDFPRLCLACPSLSPSLFLSAGLPSTLQVLSCARELWFDSASNKIPGTVTTLTLTLYSFQY